MSISIFQTVFRVLKKNPTYTIINIIGLGMGFSVSVLLLLFVHHQLSFDRFHSNAERISRLTIEGSLSDGKTIQSAVASGEIAELIKEGLPEVEEAVRLFRFGAGNIELNEERFTGESVVWADAGFFHVFSFPLISGDKNRVLTEPYSVVLSESLARKLFAGLDVIGRVLEIDGSDYQVTGIMKDMPVNSHFRHDALASFSTLLRIQPRLIENNGISFPTYVLMRQDANPDGFRSKVLAMADKIAKERFGPMGIALRYDLQPLTRIYLHTNLNLDSGNYGDIRNVYIFSFLAFFILLIAVFNYVNLITAQSEKRSREIGLRKVAGASRSDLIRQFIFESLILSLLAFLFSLSLNELLVGPASDLLGEDFRLSYWHDPAMMLKILLFIIGVAVISGLYPAFYLSRHQPAVVLKGSQHGTKGKLSFQKILVSLQFAISIFLIASLMLIHKQLGYMKERDPGFDREHVITITRLTRNIRNSFESIKAELLQNPRLLYVSASQSIPGEDNPLQNCYISGNDPSSAIMAYEMRVQSDFLNTFGLQLIAGRDFESQFRRDSSSFIVNQAAVKMLELEQPLGEDIVIFVNTGRIIGVVADFNYKSMHHHIDPLILTMNEPYFGRISIRMSPGNLKENMEYIRRVFEQADPNYTFEYKFVDDVFRQMYDKEERIGKMLSASALIAVLISFMGVFSLTSFTVSRRIKEIGIRKTLGAPVSAIILHLSSQLARWMIAGNLLAWPAAYLIVDRWQQNFAYQINLINHWWIFLTASILAGLIGFLAMFYQSLQAARANPVLSLRSE